PGGLTAYTVTVTPLSGFTGTVNLSVGSESGFPTGITSGGFNPASINTGGSSTLTMQTSTSTIPYALSLTITGTSGTISHTASTTPWTTDVPWVESPTPGARRNGVHRRLMDWTTCPSSTTYTINANTSFRDSQVSRGVRYGYAVIAITANG